MKNFLLKLDRAAQRWINDLDQQVHEPIMRSMSGEVFTHTTGTASVEGCIQPASQPEQPSFEIPAYDFRLAEGDKDSYTTRLHNIRSVPGSS